MGHLEAKAFLDRGKRQPVVNEHTHGQGPLVTIARGILDFHSNDHILVPHSKYLVVIFVVLGTTAENVSLNGAGKDVVAELGSDKGLDRLLHRIRQTRQRQVDSTKVSKGILVSAKRTKGLLVSVGVVHSTLDAHRMWALSGLTTTVRKHCGTIARIGVVFKADSTGSVGDSTCSSTCYSFKFASLCFVTHLSTMLCFVRNESILMGYRNCMKARS